MMFFLCRGEKQSGPHTLDELRAMASNQQISNSDLLWRNGWTGWRLASEVPGVLTPELPTATSEAEMLIDMPAAKRLDVSWEARIMERSDARAMPQSEKPSAGAILPSRHLQSTQNDGQKLAAPKTINTHGKRNRLLKLFTPSGRVGRIRWLSRSLLFLFGPSLFALLLSRFSVLPRQFEEATTLIIALCIVWLVAYFVGLYLGIMNSIKRLHDLNWSGSWIIPLILISFVFGIGILLLLLIPGTPGDNRFGAPEGDGILD